MNKEDEIVELLREIRDLQQMENAQATAWRIKIDAENSERMEFEKQNRESYFEEWRNLEENSRTQYLGAWSAMEKDTRSSRIAGGNSDILATYKKSIESYSRMTAAYSAVCTAIAIALGAGIVWLVLGR